MVMGLAAGAGLTLLLRRGSRARHPAVRMARVARRGAARAGRSGVARARWAARRGGQVLDRLPSAEEIREQLGDYLETAREAIDDVVSRELKDLRKAIRRQRKRLGV